MDDLLRIACPACGKVYSVPVWSRQVRNRVTEARRKARRGPQRTGTKSRVTFGAPALARGVYLYAGSIS
jgi:hypothetical protein